MFLVDTNVLIYAANRSVPEHARCRELLEAWRRQRTPWYTTWGVVYEFLRIVTHPRVLERPWTAVEAAGFVRALLASPGLRVLVETDRHADVVAEVLGLVPGLAGNVFHDVHTAALMREHGIRRIYTRDSDFHRFPFLQVRDPLV
ncbi:MAG: PIN domain-containing protein [Gemmatimonadetes bacterium]|nr:PIN domain-containing protein [Gemmatimonadota bacterium]